MSTTRRVSALVWLLPAFVPQSEAALALLLLETAFVDAAHSSTANFKKILFTIRDSAIGMGGKANASIQLPGGRT